MAHHAAADSGRSNSRCGRGPISLGDSLTAAGRSLINLAREFSRQGENSANPDERPQSPASAPMKRTARFPIEIVIPGKSADLLRPADSASTVAGSNSALIRSSALRSVHFANLTNWSTRSSTICRLRCQNSGWERSAPNEPATASSACCEPVAIRNWRTLSGKPSSVSRRL